MEICSDSRVLAVAEKIGKFIEYWGFKEVHGKVWTLIFLAPEPVDANYLKTSLKISKALISMTLKDLLYYKVIFEVEKDRPGTQKYRMNPDITQVILDVLKKREIMMLLEIQSSFQALDAAANKREIPSIQPQRLDELGLMIQTAKSVLESMTEGEQVDFKLFEQVMTIKN